VAALMVRRERGTKPFTVLSCDNIPDNGHICQGLTLQLAGLVDTDLRWGNNWGSGFFFFFFFSGV
jgi:fructuronate reductase